MFTADVSTKEASLDSRMGQLETLLVLASDFSKAQDMSIGKTSEQGFSTELFLERFLKKSFLLWIGKVGLFSNVIHAEGVELLLKLLEGADIEVDLVAPTGLRTTLLLGLKLSFEAEDTPFNSREVLTLRELPELIFCISKFR